jgi:hypothetical protein
VRSIWPYIISYFAVVALSSVILRVFGITDLLWSVLAATVFIVSALVVCPPQEG